MGDIKALEQQAATMEAESLKVVSNLPQLTVMTPMGMIQRALDSNASMEVIEKMMQLQERWEKTQARKAFDQAIAAAKSQIPVIKKNRHVGFDSKKPGASRVDYAHEDMAEIARTIDPILSKFGLSYRYRVSSNINEPISVTCIVSHRDGHFEETTLHGGRDDSGNKNALQAIGSTVTYLQRYTIKAALGLAAAEDDDGKAAGMGDVINEEQLEALRFMATEVGANMDAFCKLLKVEYLDKLPSRQFDSAMALLKSKRKAEKTEAQS